MLVALRKESVDRKHASKYHRILLQHVALRKESVDRKLIIGGIRVISYASLSARRAWIEKHLYHGAERPQPVALRKESVDRKLPDGTPVLPGARRSPQGERG